MEELIELLKQNKDNEAKKLIEIMLKDKKHEEEFARLYHMLGMIEERKEERNTLKAKYYFEKSINCIPSFRFSYYRYDDLEVEDNNIAIGFLKKGLKEFEQDIELYKRLFIRESNKEKNKIIEYFLENNIADENIYKSFIEYSYREKNYKRTVELIEKVKFKDKSKEHFYYLLKISSEILENKELENKEEIIKNITDIINEDIKNELKYWHYIILLYLEEDEENVSEIMEKIPIKCQIEDMYFWENEIDVDLNDLYMKIFEELENSFTNKKQAKIRIMKGSYLNIKINNGEDINYKLKDIKNLISALKYYDYEKEIYILIFNMYINVEKNFEAFDFAIKQYAENRIAREVFGKKKYDFYLEYTNKEDLIKIVNRLIIIKDNIQNYDISVEDLIRTFIDCIVKELFKRDMYDYIDRLVKDIKIRHLLKMKNIFEIAYSHRDKNVARQLYEYLLEENPNNSAYNNNLGVIYKEEGNLFKAKEYFEIASASDPEDNISSSNLKDVNKKISDLYEAYEEIQKEKVWVLSKLELLYEQVEDGIITCSYNERPKILKTSPEKAQELFETFTNKKYIVKIKSQDDWGRNQYRLNELVRDYTQERIEYIEADKEYENISGNINIDYLSSIGYTDELKNKIRKIEDKEIVEILLRDFKECAIAMASKQEKTAIVLSGSMAEALLNYKVQEKEIKNYSLIKDGKERKIKVKDMGLADLLEVAQKEYIIHQTDYHLTQFLRNYRNLIHPSVELRKTMNIETEEAELIWGILKKIIKDIL